MKGNFKNENESYDGDYDINNEDVDFTEYDISVSPNDFNIKTIFDFIDSGIFNIPGFQRNYVWDIKRASKLIESLLIGVPIPQIFLYEESKNKFLVIDGQQRLMTIYYFKKKRFPKDNKRVELGQIFRKENKIPDEILNDNTYFSDFNLRLPESLPGKINKYNGKNYFTLEEDDRISFDLKTIRNIIIKQNSPEDGNSVVFEIFNRLNSGGVNLKPQEIRTSLYHSDFYEMLYRINLNQNWRNLLLNTTPDVHMKDVEILLRGFAMLVNNETYKPSMTKFLNNFSFNAKNFDSEKITLLETVFTKFIDYMYSLHPLHDRYVFCTNNKRFNISMYEAIFTALCSDYYNNIRMEIKQTTIEKLQILKENKDFANASLQSTASSANVKTRIRIAKDML